VQPLQRVAGARCVVIGPLREGLADYLALRRALGYRLVRPEKLLGQFLDHLDDAGESLITVEAALDWARLPAAGGSNWWAYRLSAVRKFAAYLHTRDFRHEVRGSRSTTGSGIRSVAGVSLLDRSYTVVLKGPRRRLTAAGESAGCRRWVRRQYALLLIRSCLDSDC
jgi:hypothetical protein